MYALDAMSDRSLDKHLQPLAGRQRSSITDCSATAHGFKWKKDAGVFLTATRFVALRLLKSEKSTEFLKGLERAWIRHFGLPKIIRVDSAKGWSAEAIREWTSMRGVGAGSFSS